MRRRPVVVVVGESVAVAADLFGEHVDVLDPPVRGPSGAVVGEDQLGPAADGAGETGRLGDVGVGVGAEDIEGDHASAGVCLVDRGVHVSQ